MKQSNQASEKQIKYLKYLIIKNFPSSLRYYRGRPENESIFSSMWAMMRSLGIKMNYRIHTDLPSTEEASILIDNILNNKRQLRALYQGYKEEYSKIIEDLDTSQVSYDELSEIILKKLNS